MNIAALYGAQADLNRLLEQREQIEIDIAKKRWEIAALMALTEQNEEIDQEVGMTLGGLTEACLAAFRSAAYTPLTPMQVRERLLLMGFPIEHYRNAMAAIHTVVKRLADGGKLQTVVTSDNENAYRVTPPKKALRGRSSNRGRKSSRGGEWI
ncbi:MAG: hypothetical protein WB729_04240 [Candidatus Sulfotelmatobacter sp.]